MRSSDQRYFQVRRTKREVNLWGELGPAIAEARRQGDMNPALADLIERSAEEYTHVLLACGRTAHDFRRNFRRGCAAHNVVETREIAPHDALLGERLDGFQMLRLTREQDANVKLRWAKLREQDVLVHDPQGAVWTRVLRCMIDGPKEEHLGTLLDLRDRGLSLVRQYQERSEESREARTDKEMYRSFRHFAHGINDGLETPAEVHRELALRRYGIAVRMHETGRYLVEQTPAEARLDLEKSLVIAEEYLRTGNTDAATWDPDTSQRHCSAARLRERMIAVAGEFSARGLDDELLAMAARI